MAQEEEKKQQNTQTKDSTGDTDWEKRYKDAQAELTPLQQKVAEQEKLLDGVYPFVDWDKFEGKEKPGNSDELTGTELDFVDKAAFKKFQQEQKKKDDSRELTFDFRLRYPEMREFENEVGTVLLKQTDPRQPLKARLDAAVKTVKERIEYLKAEGVKEAEAKKKEKDKKEAETAGLEAGRTVPEDTTEKPAETSQEYVDRFKKRQENRTTMY